MTIQQPNAVISVFVCSMFYVGVCVCVYFMFASIENVNWKQILQEGKLKSVQIKSRSEVKYTAADASLDCYIIPSHTSTIHTQTHTVSFIVLNIVRMCRNMRTVYRSRIRNTHRWNVYVPSLRLLLYVWVLSLLLLVPLHFKC